MPSIVLKLVPPQITARSCVINGKRKSALFLIISQSNQREQNRNNLTDLQNFENITKIVTS